MSARMMMSTLVAIASAVALQAQAPTTAQTNRATPGEITVTGCVERADQVATPTASATVDSLTFMLIHAQKGTATEPQPTATTGSDKAATGSYYRLDADVSTLNPHVGHKVEVTGTLAPPTAPSGSTSASPTNAPLLKVDHVKLVSETCDR